MAAKVGGKVTLSDAAHLPKCLEICRRSCRSNGLVNIPVIGITWGEFSPQLMALEPVDFIIASDCFYDSKGNFENSHAVIKSKSLAEQ